MQTILGVGGVIGNGLVTVLQTYTDKIRIVSRTPLPVTGKEEIVQADLTDRQQTLDAIKGSDVVYLTAGLLYNSSVWQKQWPEIMANVIDGCKAHGVKLVFFDNVYAYGKVSGWMTEETPYNPCSKKGEVRAQIAGTLQDEIKQGNIDAMIVRAADFYGPGAANTFVHPMIFEKLIAGKKASWLGRDDVPHSFTYTPDAVKAAGLLGNTPDAYNQVWHVPTDRNVPTGKQFITMVANACNVQPNYTVLKKWMVRMAGLFNPAARESVEMMYQQEFEYLFDSSKFEKQFFSPSSYEDGITKTVESIRT